jgi:SNF2 family DNA or RNA helicase
VPSLKVDTEVGRLYVSGALSARCTKLPGAAINKRRTTKLGGMPVVELSLTLDTLRALKEAVRMTSGELAACCTPDVMLWAKAANRQERDVEEIRQRIRQGQYVPLPWMDRRLDGGPKRVPYEHQKVMASMAVQVPGLAFLCEMGTGKTRAAIEAAAELVRRGRLDGVVIVCPNSVTGTWERELRLWTDKLRPARLDGTVADRGRALNRLIGSTYAPGGVCPIINYEVLDKLKGEVVAGMTRHRIGVIFDEGHRIRNPTAKMTKAAMKIAGHAAWRLLMTGTPIVNGIENIWSQWYVVDLGITFGANYVQFRREFFDESWDGFNIEAKADTADTVGARIQRRGIRYRKADCLDLPPKVYEILDAPMGREQAQAYRDMEQQLIVEFERLEEEAEGQSTAAIQLTMLLRLAQITSGYLPNEGAPGAMYRFPSIPKLDLLDETVREQVAAGRQVIIWASFVENYRMVEERVGDLGLVKIVGGLTKVQRDSAEAEFLAGRARVFLGHPGSAGVGLNLQSGSVALYYSQDYNLEYRLQSEDRCHRSGSEIHDSVLYLDLECPGTIDTIMRQARERKLVVAEAVTEFRRALGASNG